MRIDQDRLSRALDQDVAITRVDAATIWQRARTGEILDDLAQESSSERWWMTTLATLQLVAFDAAAAAVAWSLAGGSIAVVIISAVAAHWIGVSRAASEAAA